MNANACAVIALACAAAQPALAGKLSFIHNFNVNSYGSNPIITGPDGTIYGSIGNGGSGCGSGCGTIFALAPPGNGSAKWTYHVLYRFHNGTDGAFPYSQLTLGANGILYGTSIGGGGDPVFSLAPPANGKRAWTFTVLTRFPAGIFPNPAGLGLLYSSGAFYGITSGGSTNCPYTGCGSVFKVSQDQGGTWSITTLVSFDGNRWGGSPNAIVGPTAAGAFYVANSYKNRIVYVAPKGSHATVSVSAITKGGPPSCLVLAASGTLYGVASRYFGGGEFFQVVPNNGGWTTTRLLRVHDHSYVPCPEIAGPNGSLLGTVGGDQDFYYGSVFQLTPPAGQGSWTYHNLVQFGLSGRFNPYNVVFGLNGNLYGPVYQAYGPPAGIFELQYGGGEKTHTPE